MVPSAFSSSNALSTASATSLPLRKATPYSSTFSSSTIDVYKRQVLRTLPECREVQLADCRTSLAGTLLDSVLRLLSPLM